MQRKGIERFAPLTGVLFTLLVIVAIVTVGDEGPDVKDSAQKVAAFYEDNDSEQIISSALEGLAAVLLVWFGASVRERIALVEGGAGRLASLAFAGFVIVAVGLATDAAIVFAMAESAGDISPESTEALYALYNNFFFPLVVGVALLTLSSGLASIRHGAFTKVLGWIAIVLGVVAITPVGFVSAIGTLLWVGALSIVLFVTQDRVAPGAPAAAGVHAPPSGPEAPPAPPAAPV